MGISFAECTSGFKADVAASAICVFMWLLCQALFKCDFLMLLPFVTSYLPYPYARLIMLLCLSE